MNTASFSDGIIRLPSGLKLEASLSIAQAPPEGDTADTKLAVCLHPWGWLGGRMTDPVILASKDSLLSGGYHVLRFHSRGFGNSPGWPSLTGMQEAKDLHEVVQWALEQIPFVKSLVILGYSHGSLIASSYPLLEESLNIKVSHILLSYPLGARALLTAFRGSHYAATLANLLRDSRSNVLVVYSDRDEFTGIGSYDAWADSLRREAGDRGNLEVVRIEGANHFWSYPETKDKMLQCIMNWIP